MSSMANAVSDPDFFFLSHTLRHEAQDAHRPYQNAWLIKTYDTQGLKRTCSPCILREKPVDASELPFMLKQTKSYKATLGAS